MNAEDAVLVKEIKRKRKRDLMKVVQTQLLSSSFKHDLMKVVQTQVNEELFKHNF